MTRQYGLATSEELHQVSSLGSQGTGKPTTLPSTCSLRISTKRTPPSVTYDHTYQRTRDPVRSPIDKLVRGGLVVGSVTTSESPLLYVFACGR
ncbi:hypothetical protein NOF04DRAFT_1017506 [Fusarium oxysporum II5]|nr:hypothetical protein NOF04DRAFT_1017506 [Fusarium oxysporum II5]